MLHVKTPEEVLALIDTEFAPVAETELVSLGDAMWAPWAASWPSAGARPMRRAAIF